MNKFGVVKTKMVDKLTESYIKENKKEVKELLNTIKENKEFKEMYLFYEEIENKYFEDKDVAKLYVEEINTILKNQTKNISEFTKSLDKKLGDVQINENELYSLLDILSENDNLNNIDKKVIAKKKLVDHFTTKKEKVDNEKVSHTINENLLHTVLTNNFNVLYNNTLTEEQKSEFKNIISLSNEEISTKTEELKESIKTKIDSLLNESNDSDLIKKLNKVKEEVNSKSVSRLNYFKLVELKNGLN